MRVHRPQNSLSARVQRRIARIRHIRPIPAPSRSIVTFSFDDVPKSVVENALPQLEAKGWRSTLYVATGLCDTVNHMGRHMSLEDVKAAYDAGHEIADHTYSHLDAERVSTSDFISDIERNQLELGKLGIPRSRHFAYPYGTLTSDIKRKIGQMFNTARGVTLPSGRLDASNIAAYRLFSGADLPVTLNVINKLSQEPQWIHVFGHDVRDHPSDFGCTEDELAQVIDAVAQSGAAVMTVDAAWKDINNDT